jgi:tetratricopeptide (TPR) repeat protein
LGGTTGFESAIADLQEAEQLYRQVLTAEPSNLQAGLGLGRLYGDLGRGSEAHRQYDLLLAADPGNLEVLRTKGNLVVTKQLEIALDRKSFPKVSAGLSKVLAEREGHTFDDLLRKLPPGGAAAALATVYRAIARGRFEEARKLSGQLPPGQSPPFLELVLQALQDPDRLPAGPALRGADEAYPDRTESHVWLPLVRHLERRWFRGRSLQGTSRTRVHPALLRLEALFDEARGDRPKAVELLSEALIAAPDELPARLERARLFKETGRPEQGRKDLEVALRTAQRIGLDAAAIEEIRALP